MKLLIPLLLLFAIPGFLIATKDEQQQMREVVQLVADGIVATLYPVPIFPPAERFVETRVGLSPDYWTIGATGTNRESVFANEPPETKSLFLLATSNAARSNARNDRTQGMEAVDRVFDAWNKDLKGLNLEGSRQAKLEQRLRQVHGLIMEQDRFRHLTALGLLHWPLLQIYMCYYQSLRHDLEKAGFGKDNNHKVWTHLTKVFSPQHKKKSNSHGEGSSAAPLLAAGKEISQRQQSEDEMKELYFAYENLENLPKWLDTMLAQFKKLLLRPNEEQKKELEKEMALCKELASFNEADNTETEANKVD